MSELTPAVARTLTRDWATRFPGFGVWRPLHLLRRLGPWVQGIALERSSSGDDYLPIAHVHALTRDFPVISLTLAHPLRTRGVPERIQVRDHAESYVDAARRLADGSDLPLDRPPTLAELLTAYQSFVDSNTVPAPYVELEDMACGPAALALDGPTRDGVDLADAVAESLDVAAARAARWTFVPPGFDTATGWVEHVRAQASNPAALAECVARQIATHKLAPLPSAW